MLEELTAGRAWFGRSSIRERLQLVTKCLDTVYDNATQWVDLACQIKRIDPHSSARAEEMVSGPVAVLRYLEILAQSLKDISATGCPRLPGRFKRTSAGSLRLPVVPVKGLYDSLIFPFHQGEIRMQRDVTPETLAAHLAYTYRQRHADSARLAVVLGAGNVTSIPVADVLTKMFRDNCVVLLKLHPVTAPLEETFRRALSPLVDRSLLRITVGDQRLGEALVHDSRVDTVHITGSHRAYQAIVRGSDAVKPSENSHQPLVTFAGTADDGPKDVPPPRLRQGDGQSHLSNETGVRRETKRRLNKEVTAELGNVSPWIVVPGHYSSRDLNEQAECLAQSIVNNVSFNCVATKVIVTWRQWKQRDAFLDQVERIISRVPRRVAWYPGAADHFERSLGIQADNEGRLPWTFLRNVAWDQPASFFREEFFGCVFADVAIDADDERQFVRRAFDFANDRLFGSLAATLTVPNAYRRADATGRFFQEELDRMRSQAI